MAASNRTSFHPSTFILLGIPGLEAIHGWISIPFCTLYIVSLLGNCLLLAIIKTEPSLHEPMYIFLSMLLVSNMIVSSITLPKILCIFWFKDWDIRTDTCVTQMYVLLSLQSIQSGIIVAMGFDRYIAIHNPLRHSAILNSRTISKIGLGAVLRGVALLAPNPFLVKAPSFCENVISNTYCDYIALLIIVCDDTSAMGLYSQAVGILVAGVDIFLIILFYVLILQTVFKLTTKEGRLKSLNTCSSHICIIIVSYTLGIFSSVSHLFGLNAPPHVDVILRNVYHLGQGILDPILYGVRSKKIRDSVLKFFSVKGCHTVS